MRVLVRQVKGKRAVDTVEDVLCDALARHYSVSRQKKFEFTNAAGQKDTMIAGVVLPKQKLIIEIQDKQDNKSIIAEMAREKVAREAGWSVYRVTEAQVKGDMDTVLYKVGREVQRLSF